MCSNNIYDFMHKLAVFLNAGVALKPPLSMWIGATRSSLIQNRVMPLKYVTETNAECLCIHGFISVHLDDLLQNRKGIHLELRVSPSTCGTF